jgi:ATPase family associated with various cellular activities (AAA)
MLKTKRRIQGTQQEALEMGKKYRKRLTAVISKICDNSPVNNYQHLYVYGPAGIGKTFLVKKQLDESGINYNLVTGANSIFTLGVFLAVLQYANPERAKRYIFVDDCDEILKSESNCNIMKNVLFGEKKFVYEKSMNSLLPALTEVQRSAILNFSSDDKMGYSVPTDNLVFIFTSNFKLACDDEVQEAREKGRSKAVLMSHHNAIRSRVKCADFDLSDAEKWGWAADVVLNTPCLGSLNLTYEERKQILDFNWNNWDRLKERSIRSIEKIAVALIENPEDYEDVWAIDFLKN